MPINSIIVLGKKFISGILDRWMGKEILLYLREMMQFS